MDQKQIEENDYFSNYKEKLRYKLVEEPEDAEKKREFWNYMEKTYRYVQKERKYCQNCFFQSETLILRIGLLITLVNAVVTALTANDLDNVFTIALPVVATFLSAYLSYKQSVISKKKYHERWNRHNIHYILFNKECRDYAECLDPYGVNVDVKEARELFIKRIYKIEDNDIDAFYNNVQNLAQK